MKILLSILSLFVLTVSFGQVKTVQKTVPSFKAEASNSRMKTLVSPDKTPHIFGNFSAGEYSIIIKNKETNTLIRDIIGSPVSITETSISGDLIENTQFNIIESEVLETADFLFRLFDEVQDEIPENLPNQLLVHKTNHPSYYGIAELSDGTVIIPHNGLLLYLKRH